MAIDGQISAQVIWDEVERLTNPPKFDPTKLDIPFCRKVLEFAKAEHKDFTFNMHYWHAPTQSLYSTTACGTTACLAGTAVHLSPEAEIVDRMEGVGDCCAVGSSEDYGRYIEIDGEPYSWSGAGAKLMGLDSTTAFELFIRPASASLVPGVAERKALGILENLIAAAEKAQYGQE